MRRNFIVRSESGTFYCFYYTYEKGICKKTYQNGKWSSAETVVASANRCYSVTPSVETPEGNSECLIYLFYQDAEGSVNLCTNRGGAWKTKVISENKSGVKNDIIFKAIISDKGLKLFYNEPEPDGKVQTLNSRRTNQKGEWITNVIERFVPLPEGIFQTQAVSRGHLLLFYQTQREDSSGNKSFLLGYREATTDRLGDFVIINESVSPVVDYSFLTTQNAVHAAFIVKGLFSYQLIYKVKRGKDFSEPVVVWENGRFDNCLLYIVKNVLHLSFISGGQLYVCKAEPDGSAFSKPIRYRNKICSNPIKADYLSLKPMNENDFFVREVYVDNFNPWDIQIIPDMYDDFYSGGLVQIKNAKDLEQTEQDKEVKIISPYDEEILNQINNLKAEIALLQQQNNEKNLKIQRLQGLLADSRVDNDEI